MTEMAKFHGFDGLMALLKLLNRNRIQFRLEQQRDDCIMVSFAFVGSRVEVEVFFDHIEYSVFRGNENIEFNQEKLLKFIFEESV